MTACHSDRTARRACRKHRNPLHIKSLFGSNTMANEILTTRKGPVLEITLNRPEIGNAVSDAMATELTGLLLRAGESAEIVVLRGAGEDFCVGRESMGKRPPGA